MVENRPFVLSSRNDAVREYFAAQIGLGPQEDGEGLVQEALWL
jgi:hypothetical protein